MVVLGPATERRKMSDSEVSEFTTVVVEGQACRVRNKSIMERRVVLNPGDFYVACRNTGWKLGCVKKDDTQLGCVFAEDAAMYPYDRYECYEFIEFV